MKDKTLDFYYIWVETTLILRKKKRGIGIWDRQGTQ